MKNFFAIGCLLILLLLSACGSGKPGGNSPAASDAPEKTEAAVVTAPSTPPESTVTPAAEAAAPSSDASAQAADAEKMVVEIPQKEATPQVQEPAPPAPAAEAPSAQAPVQAQPSASEPFTGVMGTVFVVPDGFIQLDENPNIGYQYTFWHPDYEVRIEVSEIAPGYLPEGAWETDRSNASNDPDVTYFKEGNDWFVESGYHNNGDEIFYVKEGSADGGLKSFRITYPTAKREFGDAITAEFEQSCRF